MNTKFRNPLTKNQTIGTAVTVAGVTAYLVIRHKLNVVAEEAAADALANWIQENQSAGFEVLVLSRNLLDMINLKVSEAHLAAAA